MDNSGLGIQTLESQLDKKERDITEPVAIIGLSCRFTGASYPEIFWKILRAGANVASKIPEERLPSDIYYNNDPNVRERPVPLTPSIACFWKSVGRL